MATITSPVPSGFKVVDHTMSRVAGKGCMAVTEAEGDERPVIFDPNP